MTSLRRAVIALVLYVATSASAIEGVRVPLGVFAPRQPDGFVTIPGAPLPALPAASVRDAITFYEPALGFMRLAGDTPSTAHGIDYLATLYAAIGNYEKSERLFDEAQKILEKYPAGELLASLHNDRESRMARTNHREFLEARAAALGNLATAYNLLGDAENSEGAYLDALSLLRQLDQEKSNKGQIVRVNLAQLYGSISDYEGARSILEKLLAEAGLTAKLQFAARMQLGYALAGLQQFPEAMRRLQEALDMTTSETPERATALLNVASVHAWAGDYGEAEKFAQESLRLTRKLYGEDSRIGAGATVELATNAISRGELDQADDLLRRALPVLARTSGDEELYVFTTRALALVARLRRQNTRARELSRRALALSKKNCRGFSRLAPNPSGWRFEARPLLTINSQIWVIPRFSPMPCSI